MSTDDRDTPPNSIRDYHHRTKHAPQRYAIGPAFLDWESQPNPFRLYPGSRKIRLPLAPHAITPAFAHLGERGQDATSQALTSATLGLFLELALGLSAWKEVEGQRWTLRQNPSSGNLHPTESWLVLPPLDGISETTGLYHYSPLLHGLEDRRSPLTLPALPPGLILLALSSVVWREAWKYGERAFRYTQLDVGHAIGSIAYAAACLGWRVRMVSELSDADLAHHLGLDRAESQHRFEEEHPDLLLAIDTAPADGEDLPLPPLRDDWGGQWHGIANLLSEDHERWPAIERALRFSIKPATASPPPTAPLSPQGLPPGPLHPASEVIRRRRSAQRMDPTGSSIGREVFFRILAATLPALAPVPFAAFPWPPRLALVLFVHQVEGLTPGLYLLPRDGASLERLRAASDPAFFWSPVADCPIPLYHLADGDLRKQANKLSCLQAIAGHSAFSLGMIADYDRTLTEEGDWAYRRLFWEGGLIGQALYLEATAAGLAGTGIGCFFDDEVARTLGLDPTKDEWQSLYHFTIGRPLEDSRLLTWPAYHHLDTAWEDEDGS